MDCTAVQQSDRERPTTRATKAIRFALEVLPAAGEPGNPSPGELASDLAFILQARLDDAERLLLASSAVMALDGDERDYLCDAAVGLCCAVEPHPPLLDLRSEARNWASLATLAELKAYAAAIWNRLPESERASFLRAIRPSRRAA